MCMGVPPSGRACVAKYSRRAGTNARHTAGAFCQHWTWPLDTHGSSRRRAGRSDRNLAVHTGGVGSGCRTTQQRTT